MRRALILLMLPTLATAGTTVDVDSLSVDGLPIRDLHCDLTQGGLFASVAVAGVLAEKKTAFDACAPDGAAVTLSWRWDGGATHDVRAGSSAPEGASACVRTAMTTIQSPQSGTCRATLLVGDADAAQRAWAASSGRTPSPSAAHASEADKPAQSKQGPE